MNGTTPPQLGPDTFHDLIEAAPDAVVLVDESGTIQLVNQQAERLFGYSRRELLGQSVDMLLPERFRRHHLAHRAAYARDPQPRPMGAALDLYGRRKDGTEFPTEISLSSVRTERGTLAMAALRDVSDRRRMEEALRFDEERFRLLVEAVREYAIFMLDTDGRVTTWNAGAERLKGYSASEIVGQHFSRFYTEEDVAAGAPQQALDEAARSGQSRHEGRRLRKDGSTFQADVTITPLRNADGTLRGFAKVTYDVTERRRAEADRERAVQAREEVLGLVSHDLQNAINALALNTHLLLRTPVVTEPEAQMHRYGEIVRDSATAMSRLIRDVLDVRRLEAGHFVVERRPEDVTVLLDTALEPLHAMAASKSIRLHATVEPGLGRALCDRDRIFQVLHNLIGNAIKFTPEGGEVRVDARREGADLRLAVIDSGPGIRPEHMPYVFDRYWQAEGKERRQGSGLGLFIVKSLVEAHGGRIWVENASGTGAAFVFTLEPS